MPGGWGPGPQGGPPGGGESVEGALLCEEGGEQMRPPVPEPGISPRAGACVKVPRSYCCMTWSWAVAVPQAHT